MVDQLTIYGYLLTNTLSQHTYISYTLQKILLALDFTFVNGPATQYTIPSNQLIKLEFVFNFDYLTIQQTLFNNVISISNCCENRYNIKNTNKNIQSIAFVKILEHLQGSLNILIDTNSPISITDLKNTALALIITIISKQQRSVILAQQSNHDGIKLLLKQLPTYNNSRNKYLEIHGF